MIHLELDQRLKHLRETTDQVREIERLRLEDQTMALWPDRTDPRTSDSLIRIAERRARLLGLDAQPDVLGEFVTRGAALFWEIRPAEEVTINEEAIGVPGNGGGDISAQAK